MGPSEPIKVFSYFYAKNSRGEWTLPRRCRKPDLYSTDRNRWVYMKWVRYSQLKEYEWQNKLMLRIEVRLYGDSETTHDDAINSGTIPAQNSTLIRNMQQLCNDSLKLCLSLFTFFQLKEDEYARKNAPNNADFVKKCTFFIRK